MHARQLSNHRSFSARTDLCADSQNDGDQEAATVLQKLSRPMTCNKCFALPTHSIRTKRPPSGCGLEPSLCDPWALKLMFVEFELPHLSVVHFGPKDAVQLFFFFFSLPATGDRHSPV
ncbi:hypothetical protein VTN31DRAFT_290 [Thermomyces dupontii]|uniref:uncharacterized protein n=1 Tax=Talaromyces thermophilus TaxID=28565 RepID=UPI0037449008